MIQTNKLVKTPTCNFHLAVHAFVFWVQYGGSAKRFLTLHKISQKHISEVQVKQFSFASSVVAIIFFCASANADQNSLLLEAESFAQPAGWKLDTQFIGEMGSPYLLAHGLGKPVANAQTDIKFPKTGTYNVWVRTKDWVARWDAKEAPGRFKVLVNGKELNTEFGIEGASWHWQAGGQVEIDNVAASIKLADLTGFDGRCDAIYFSLDDTAPPNDDSLAKWRRDKLGLAENPTQMNGYDLVVVGGGYAGMGAAISAARMGCKVALIQNRGVLGGNGSSEVRVWAMGNIRRGVYPRIGEIINEFADNAKKSPGTYEEFGDSHKETIVRAEPNIDLFLNHHAYAVTTENNLIKTVSAFDTRTSEQKEFHSKLFSDCTGHGTIGFLANAQWEMTPKGRMGMSNMWAWAEEAQPVEFPNTDKWALDLNMEDFPYPRDHHGQWFWEGGFDKDPLKDAEGIRDWNFRAVYGAFNAMKNRDGADKHANAVLTWMAFIGGPRESRRMIGDVVLTAEDITSKRIFKDGSVPTTWSIDLHYPKEQYAIKYPDNPFISKAVHDRSVDRNVGYPVPYRCFYSKNINNLFLAGRCVSVTHEALGTVRVMKTCGMMGEVVGKAASICRKHDCDPRGVYEQYWDEMDKLLVLPGGARRLTVNADIVMPEIIPDIPPDATKLKLPGVSRDDSMGKTVGNWKSGSELKGYLGIGYQYASPGSNAKMIFEMRAPKTNTYDVRIGWRFHQNRASNAKVNVTADSVNQDFTVNMQKEPEIDGAMETLAKIKLEANEKCLITFDATGADGNICVDAVQLVPSK